MPCSMYEGATSGDFAKDDAERARLKAEEAMAEANKLTAILCGLLRSLPPEMIEKLDPTTKAWFEGHKEHDAKHGR